MKGDSVTYDKKYAKNDKVTEADMFHSIQVLAYDGCIGSATLGPADLFGVANSLLEHQGRDAMFDVKILSIHDRLDVRTGSGHIIRCDGLLADSAPARSTLMLPGSDIRSAKDVESRARNVAVPLQSVLDWYDAGSQITANCTATFLLAATGLLDGKRATTSWWLEEAFRDLFPAVNLTPEEILVEDGQLITTAAGTSHIDLALHLIGRLEGPKLASLCAHFMVVDGGRSSQRPYTVPWHFMSRDPLIEKADTWIRERLSHSIRISELAHFLGVETRTLNRRFHKITGSTPQAYVKNARMDKAKVLLETTPQTIGSIGSAVGYQDENAFRRAFFSAVEMTPASYRRQFKRLE